MNQTGVEFLGTISRHKKGKKIWWCLFTFSNNREIRHFNVVVMQKQQRNAQKSLIHVQSCLFANVSCKTRESDVIWRFDVGSTWTRLLDGKANGCLQWFLFLCSIAAGQEKPLLAGYKVGGKSSKMETLNQEKVGGSWTVSLCRCHFL